MLEAKSIVIATGSAPASLPGVNVDQDRIVDSTGALSFPSVPENLVVIGAGIIGLELGSVWRRLGSKVTVVEYLERITPGLDGEIAKTFQRILTKQGMVFRLGCKVTGATVAGDHVDLAFEPVSGGAAETISADRVLLAIGRTPVTDGLGLAEAGVAVDRRGYIETDHFRTNVAGVYAIGDVTHGPMLAHKAEDEAVACIEIIAGKAGHVNYKVIPNVVYTHPEVASVGQDRGRAEGRRARLQGRQVPLHRQCPGQGQSRDRRLREGARRRRHRRGSGRAHDRPGRLAR